MHTRPCACGGARQSARNNRIRISCLATPLLMLLLQGITVLPQSSADPAIPDPLAIPTSTTDPANERDQNNTPAALFFTELLIDPKAVLDEAGEWFEIYNAGNATVDLYNWTVADTKRDRYTFRTPLQLAPGAYLVVGKSTDMATNGGAPVAVAGVPPTVGSIAQGRAR